MKFKTMVKSNGKYYKAGVDVPVEDEMSEKLKLLGGMTVAELKAYAKENEIALNDATTKPDILEVITAALTEKEKKEE